MIITLPWPAHTLSPNTRQHHMALHRAKAKYREACRISVLMLPAASRQVPDGRLLVEMQFCPPDKRRYDVDGICSRMKSGLDGVADALQLNDERFRPVPLPMGGVVRGGAVYLKITQEKP